jgi:hypothetical protein
MAIKYINIFQSKDAKIFQKIGMFGLEINHLATLMYAPVITIVLVDFYPFSAKKWPFLKSQCHDQFGMH